jgi:hypothetical protein
VRSRTSKIVGRMQAKTRISAVRRRRAILSVLLFGFACAFMIQEAGWAQISNYALVKGLAHGTPKIDAYHWETRDESYYRGHYYSVKAPGLAFMTVPLYKGLDAVDAQSLSRRAATTAREHGAGRWMHGTPPLTLYGADSQRASDVRKTIQDETVMIWVLALFGAVLPAIALLLLVRSVAERLEPGFGTAAAVTLGLGTLILPFATLFFSHVLSALLVFGAFTLLWNEREGPPRLGLVGLAGLLCGFAVTTEYPLAIAGAILGVYAVSREGFARRGGAYVAGVALGVLPLVLYNVWAFGSVTHFSYEDAVAYQGLSGHDLLGLNDRGFFGIDLPSPIVALKLLFAAKGLLTLSPVLALGIVGTVLLYRRGNRAEALVIGGIALAYLLYNSGYYLPFGGGSPGPRFLIPILPFLAVPLAISYKRLPAATVALAVPSVLMMVAATTTVPLIGNEDIGSWLHLVRVGIFEHTVVSVLGGDDSWGAIAPVFAALGGSLVLAVLATPRLRVGREARLAFGLVACWAAAAGLGLRFLSGEEADSGGSFALVGIAALTSALTLLAVALAEQRPWERGWLGGRAEAQRELSS